MRTGVRALLATALLLPAGSAPGTAQENTAPPRYDMEPAQRVRVTLIGDGERIAGHVLRVTTDSLVLESLVPGALEFSTRGLAWDEVRDVERSLGHPHHGLEGAVASLVGMAGAWLAFTVPEFAFYLLVPPTPSLLGAGLGFLYSPERWEALPREPRPGERLRVDGATVGTLVALDSGGVVLSAQDPGEPHRTIPLESIASLERSLGTRSRAWGGAFYGAALGVGAIFADAPYPGWVAPPAGAVLGLAVGSLLERERWGKALIP